MTSVAAKVAVIGSGISGAVCASTLAKNGISVTLFESARGPGGRMSQRRENAEDGRELYFDHGAPYFTASNPDVLRLISEWQSRGVVAEWKEKFATFDFASKQFLDIEEESSDKKYVGVPGMNSICKSLCQEPGVQSRFGVGVGRLEWLENDDSWSLIGLDGESLGFFKGVVTSDKSTFSPKFTKVTGKPMPIDMGKFPEIPLKMTEIPVSPRFALMLAFEEPLSEIPIRGFSFKNSEVLRWAHCDSSKPGRSHNSECWVLHSTAEYARDVIAKTGLQKPSSATLTKVAEDLFQEFQSTKLNIPQAFFKKAHRWGSAFPATSIAGDEKCLWDAKKRLAICGDFCVSPNVEGAIVSGLAAAAKCSEVFSRL
uniref:Renalase n=1 Tax=Nicotiana tabacum TaxID=4097 RepID=A0A1S3YQF5_TOBAC|nr:PREDICTED: renalase-like [Nicotiana tabacum]